MEGVGGVNDADEQVLPGQRRYAETQRLQAGEMNAAVSGALAGGASEVAIWDGHDGSRSLVVDAIHPKATLIQGKPTPANYYLSEKAYDGIMFVGQHAMAGAKGGSWPIRRASGSGRFRSTVRRWARSGRPRRSGTFRHSVIMLSGDQAAATRFSIAAGRRDRCRQAHGGEGVVGQPLSWEAKHRIESAARDAVRRCPA
jgi:D-amino peptidase